MDRMWSAFGKKVIPPIACGIGALFLFAGMAKSANVTRFAEAFSASGAVSFQSLLLGTAIATAEIFLGIMMILSSGRLCRWFSGVCAIVLFVFTIWLLAQPAGYVCPCFAASESRLMHWLNDHAVGRNTVLILLLVFVVSGSSDSTPQPRKVPPRATVEVAE
jgi:hypothetical protein